MQFRQPLQKSLISDMIKRLKWLDENLEEILMSVLLIGISVLVIGQVVARYLFNSSLSWSDELARYFLVWSTFLSVSYCVKKRISIKIDQFQNAMPKGSIPWIKMIRHTIVFVFCILMIPYAWEYVRQAAFNGSTSPALKLPMYYIQSAPLVGLLLLTVRVAQAWVREYKLSRKYMLESLKHPLREDYNKNKEGEE